MRESKGTEPGQVVIAPRHDPSRLVRKGQVAWVFHAVTAPFARRWFVRPAATEMD